MIAWCYYLERSLLRIYLLIGVEVLLVLGELGELVFELVRERGYGLVRICTGLKLVVVRAP